MCDSEATKTRNVLQLKDVPSFGVLPMIKSDELNRKGSNEEGNVAQK